MKLAKHHRQSPPGLLIGIILICGCTCAWASIESECTQEAEEFGVVPEQFEDYVTACIYSRGGDLADFSPPPEGAANDEPSSAPGMPDMENVEMPAHQTPEYNQTAY